MVFHCFSSRVLLNRIAVAASAFALFVLPYGAQAQTGPASEGGQQYSSSADWKSYLTDYDFDGAAGANASPQYGQNNRYPDYTNKWSHVAFEGGGGFTAPVGNDTHGIETWGYNLGLGAGWNFTKRFGTLIEYQFDKQKIPGATIAAVGAQGGNINTWSFTLDPVFYQPLTRSLGGYVTGGLGFYRKVTNFTDLAPVYQCFYFCYLGYAPQTVAHFSSNQLGANVGIGGYWKAFGEDSNAKFFAEARYTWVDSPRASKTQNGEGTEGLIPVTFGIRF